MGRVERRIGNMETQVAVLRSEVRRGTKKAALAAVLPHLFWFVLAVSAQCQGKPIPVPPAAHAAPAHS